MHEAPLSLPDKSDPARLAKRIANHGPLALKILPNYTPMWILRCRELLVNLALQLRQPQRSEMHIIQHLTALLKLPALVLSKPKRGGSHRKSWAAIIQSKLEQEGLVSQIIEQSSPQLSQESTYNRRRQLNQRNHDHSMALRAQQLISSGHITRAIHSLKSNMTMADMSSPEVINKLELLHPPSHDQLPKLPSDAPRMQVDREATAKLMLSSDNGSAPGPSGWGSNMLSILADDPESVDALCTLIEQIINDDLPSTARTLLTSCSLIALNKDEKGGIRPIAMSELFYRIAAQYALGIVTPHIHSILAPHQFGVGVSDGCTQIIHSLQHSLVSPTEQLACIGIDITNAFNSISRRAILERLFSYQSLQPLWRIANFGYQEHSLLITNANESDADGTIFSRTGVRQGDPLSALLFSLAIQPHYVAAASLTSRNCHAFIDDAYFTGSPEQCLAALDHLRNSLRSVNLTVNTSKCTFTYFHSETQALDTSVVTQLEEQSIPILTESFELLGAVIGKDNEATKSALDNSRAKWRLEQDALFTRLEYLTSQTQMLILQRLGTSAINYRLRAMPPSVTENLARITDDRVLVQAAGAIGIPNLLADSNLPMHNRAIQEIQAPLSKGGFGLISTQLIAPAAYLASIHNSLTRAPTFTVASLQSPRYDPGSLLAFNINDSITRIRSRESSISDSIDPTLTTPPSLLPHDPATFFHHFTNLRLPNVQQALSQRTQNLQLLARLNAAKRSKGSQDQARLLSLQAKHSSRWLQVVPTTKQSRLTDTQYYWASRLRLGLDVPYSVDNSDCPSCGETNALRNDSWHALSCLTHRSREVTDRHNFVVDAIERHYRMAGVRTWKEPTKQGKRDNSRPDLKAFEPVGTLLTDVSVTHPLAPSNLAKAKKSTLACAESRAQIKITKYSPMAKDQDATFVPFPCETLGGIHKLALKVVKRIAQSADDMTSLYPQTTLTSSLLDTVAISIQKGNALVMIAASIEARRIRSGV